MSNLLIDVAATGPESVLSIGHWTSDVLSRVSFAILWDGSAWVDVPLPDLSEFGTHPSIEGVGVAGGLWAVGYVRTGYPTDQLPLVMEWTGAGWGSIQTPALRQQTEYPFSDRGGLAHDVEGVGPDDLWVVGTAAGYGDASATSVAMALHFDGSEWRDVEVPIAGNRTNNLDAVSASGPDNVWAVGHWRHVAAPYQALIVRWDGSKWARVPNPGEGSNDGDAEAVLALSPDDVWVSGSFNSGVDHLIHWTGSAWEVPPVVLPGPFASFARIAPDDLWASCAINATFHHYDGSAWTPAASPDIPGSTYILRGWGMSAIGPCEVWSVGGYSDGTMQYTLAERLGPGACAGDFNGDGSLDVFDFLAFQTAFGDGSLEADIAPPFGVLNIFDFLTFQTAFSEGC